MTAIKLKLKDLIYDTVQYQHDDEIKTDDDFDRVLDNTEYRNEAIRTLINELENMEVK